MSFTVASYNVLAPAYVRARYYPSTPAELLDPGNRIPALVEHLVGLHADVLCLQEVEAAIYSAISRRLGALGYEGGLAGKGRDKPDGCATFFRTAAFARVREVRVEYEDGDSGRPRSGHVAHILLLEAAERVLGVANTHLKWDPPHTARDRQFGYRQVSQLIKECGTQSPTPAGWVICGDLNVSEDSDVVAALRDAGFEHSHAGRFAAPTCNPNGRAKMIDFVFHDHALRATPVPLPPIDDRTPLPGPGQPSDHLALLTRLQWR